MSSVIHLRTRRQRSAQDALVAVDKALGEVFVQLAKKYGPHAVATVALSYVAVAIEQTRLKHRDDPWIADLKTRFEKALKGTP